jgi:hypothetical protein
VSQAATVMVLALFAAANAPNSNETFAASFGSNIAVLFLFCDKQ